MPQQPIPLVSSSKALLIAIAVGYALVAFVPIGTWLWLFGVYGVAGAKKMILWGAFLAALSIMALALRELMQLEQWVLYEDRLEGVSPFGLFKKVILRSEMSGWAELRTLPKGKTTYHYIFIVFTDDDKQHRIKSYYTSKYDTLIEHLILWLVHKEEKEHAAKRAFNKGIAQRLFGLAIMLILFSAFQLLYCNVKIAPDQTVTVKGVLAEKPKMKVPLYNTRKGVPAGWKKNVSFKLTDYPDVVFSSSYGLNFVDRTVAVFVSDLYPGDSLFLETSPSELERLRSAKPGVGLFQNIDIYSIGSKRKSYFNLAGYNTANLFWVQITIGITAALGAILAAVGYFLQYSA